MLYQVLVHVLTFQQVEELYPRNTWGEYVLCKNKNTCVDAKKTNTNVVRYAGSRCGRGAATTSGAGGRRRGAARSSSRRRRWRSR
eukprot:COSAG02_NODE_453_length_22025_cov_16.179923_10_plen_85_part_00